MGSHKKQKSKKLFSFLDISSFHHFEKERKVKPATYNNDDEIFTVFRFIIRHWESVLRHQVTEKEIASILCDILQAVKRRNLAKGRGGFVSSHEIMGLMLEEWDEAREALHGNDHPQLRQELLDMIVVGVVGIISIDSGKLEF